MANKDYVLVVDDDEDILSALLFALNEEGFDAEGARNAEEARIALQKDPLPSLILLDYMLPGISGADFLKQIKQEDRLRGVPVVISSAAGAPAARLAQSIEGFLEKPIHLEVLFDVVGRFVDKGQTRG